LSFPGICELNVMANRIYTDPTQPGHYTVEGTLPISVRHNENTHSLRLQTGDEQRLFFLEQEPHSPRMHICSEYGIRSGNCRVDDLESGRGTIRYDGTKFHFRRDGNELQVHRDGGQGGEFTWLLSEPAPLEALSGILMLLCRQALQMHRTTV
jgi:hypothetical protein